MIDENKTHKIYMSILAAVCLLIGGVGYIILSYNYGEGVICQQSGNFFVATVVWFASVLLICVRIRRGQAVRQIKGTWLNIPYMFAAAFVAAFIEELVWNSEFGSINKLYFALDVVIAFMVTVSLFLLIRKAGVAYILVVFLDYTYGLTNFFVLKFRGSVPLFDDFKAAGTAMSVMGNYDYSLEDGVVVGTLLCMLWVVLVLYFPPLKIELHKEIKRKLAYYISSVAAVCVLWLFVLNTDLWAKTGAEINQWDPTFNFKENGAPLSMLLSIQNSRITKPDNYSEQEMEKVLSVYEDKNSETSTEEMPSVFIIMNESFSDLSILNEFDSDSYLGNLENIDSYIMRGYAYTSVYGGGTPASEFEFLTGCTMADVKPGVFPYMTYDLSAAYSMVDIFNKLGYETIAFHPSIPGNWNRIEAYEALGFQQFLSIDDMQEIGYFGWRVSDESDYAKVKEIYEGRTAPIFLFNVTMQNHGGYEALYSAETKLVSIEDQYAGYSDVINYLTLMRESDRAFFDLLTYFSQQSDPVVVCLFGDHQPRLDEEFVSALLGTEEEDDVEWNEKFYMTPYVIWSNYEMNIEQQEVDMSLNYLGANLLHILGLDTQFSSYLLDLQKDIPVINTVGYQTSDGVWHSWEEELNEQLIQYQKMQYYELFDDKSEE